MSRNTLSTTLHLNKNFRSLKLIGFGAKEANCKIKDYLGVNPFTKYRARGRVEPPRLDLDIRTLAFDKINPSLPLALTSWVQSLKKMSIRVFPLAVDEM